MTARALVGAAALGLMGAAIAYAVAGRRHDGPPARPRSNTPYGRDILASLNWQRPDNSFVFRPYSAPPQPATVADGAGALRQLFGQFGNFAGLSMTTTKPDAATARPLLNMIGGMEAPQGYNQVYGGSLIRPPRPLTQMSVQDVLDWQARSIGAGSRSSAAGRYQVLRRTLLDAVRRGVVGTNERFSPDVQDRIALDLANRRGLSRYQAGKMTATDFANSLAREWASLPMVTGSRAGQSYYGGDGLNAALTTPEMVLGVLSRIRGA